MEQQLNQLISSAKQAISQAETLEGLDHLRVQYLGKKGELTEWLKSVSGLSAEQKPLLGKAINEAKQLLQELIIRKQTELTSKSLETQLAGEALDITLPGRGEHNGHLHPITRMTRRIEAIFTSMGFCIAQGPEIEDEEHNFTALNVPADHPARAMQDTFYITERYLLRTQTSPVQIREMKKHGVPIRLIAPGRVYRRDSDMTHSPMFHQVEGLIVDRDITFAQLKGLLQDFLNSVFERKVVLRFRPSYFPFTEPSAEVDIQKPDGGWMEVLGCGMVHPNVLRNVGVDPEIFSGFAFGVGIDRLAMLRYQVPDLRLFFSNDERFLQQF